MPQTITIAAFVLGAVLLLTALLGGRFKIFGAEVSVTTGRLARAIAFVFSLFFISIGLMKFSETPPSESNSAPSTRTLPPIEPPPTEMQPAKLPQPAVQTLNISGLWRDGVGMNYYITQNGDSFTFTASNPYNGAASSGSGTIAQNQVISSFQTNLPSFGKGSGAVSADGQVMQGTFFDSVLGQYTLTLYKVN